MLISVIIPCYNVAQYVGDALHSCFSQKDVELEVICVDNGSTDNTVEVVRQFKDAILLHESRRGAPAARNTGLAAAKGEWIQFLDADDLLQANKLSRQAAIAGKSSQRTGFLIAPYVRQKQGGELYKVPFQPEDIWLGLMRSQAGITSSNLWRRGALEACGGWNEDLESSQEYDLMFRILKEGWDFAPDHEVAATVRDRSGSISTSAEDKRWARYVDLRLVILQFLISQKINVHKHPFYGNIVLGHIRKLWLLNKGQSLHRYTMLTDLMAVGTLELSALYKFLLRIFGFSRTQNILQLFGRS